MAGRGIGMSVIQYGIRLNGSKSVLMVTEDLAEAERTLDMVGHARLITRRVTYGPWMDVESRGHSGRSGFGRRRSLDGRARQWSSCASSSLCWRASPPVYHLRPKTVLESLQRRQVCGMVRSISSSQIRADMSDGARQSPRGDKDPPWDTLGPFGSAERLNCESE
jgi:hypothetical protein